jgi:CheY-like chemotaxis protein
MSDKPIVLIAEDDELCQILLQDALDDEFEVKVVNNGLECLAHCEVS